MMTDLDYRLIRLDQAANDYYITIVHKDSEEIERLTNEKEAYEKLVEASKKEEDPLREYYEERVKYYTAELKKYPKFGYGALDHTTYKALDKRKKSLEELFTRKYGRYRLGYSSYIEFQDQLQLTFDTIAEYYNDRFDVRDHYKEYYTKEFEEDNPFATRSTTTMENKGTNTSKEATLPDIHIQQPVYTGMGSQESNNNGEVTVSDTSFVTKLAGISGYLSFDKYLIKDYLNEFNLLFQTLIW